MGACSLTRICLEPGTFHRGLTALLHKPLPLSPGVWPIVPYGTQEVTNLQGPPASP